MEKESGSTARRNRGSQDLRSDRSGRHNTALRRVAWPIIAAMIAVGTISGAVAAQEDAVPVAISVEETAPKPSCAGTAAVAGSTELIQDCETLLAAQTVLEGNGQELNWSTDISMRRWAGIRLAETDSHVDRIDLQLRGLAGEIPPVLGDLTGPRYIKLSYNSLTGPIPTELGNLTTLQQLFLNNNELTGSIPPELSNLTGLTHLQLDRNDLTGLIPPELGLIESLRSLRLGFNRLSGCIPTALHESPHFNSEPSTAVGIPLCSPGVCQETDAVGESTTDVRLIMDCDVLLDVQPVLDPDEILNWSTDVAIAEWDGITIIDKGYGPQVGALELGFRFLSGTVPEDLGHLPALTRLDLSQNLLTGTIPARLGNLNQLQVLDLHGNLLSGEIPPELGKLASLTELALHNNSLTGEIPPELGDLGELTTLLLGDNLLTGEIPAELGELTGLTNLDLGDNRLTGEIPTDLSGLTELTMLSLGDDRLTGEIPTDLSGLTELTMLSLGGNKLAGCVPGNLLEETRNDLTALELSACDDE